MGKKLLKALGIILAVAFVATVLFFVNAIFGNPVSAFLADKGAQKYLEQHYAETDFYIDRVSFDFKSTNYHAFIKSPTSIDSSFSLTIGMNGKVWYDTYEDRVLNFHNTSQRISGQYRAAVDSVIESESFPYNAHFAFGDIEFKDSDHPADASMPDYALMRSDLELDADYDIVEFGKKAGHLTIYIYDETVSTERLTEILLKIKELMDEAAISFYVIDCVLEYEREPEGEIREGRVEVMNFLYSDIYEENLLERVEKSNEDALTYYDEMDSLKEAEAEALQNNINETER